MMLSVKSYNLPQFLEDYIDLKLFSRFLPHLFVDPAIVYWVNRVIECIDSYNTHDPLNRIPYPVNVISSFSSTRLKANLP